MHIKTNRSLGQFGWTMKDGRALRFTVARIETFTAPSEDGRAVVTQIIYSFTENDKAGRVRWYQAEEPKVFRTKPELLASL